MACAPGVASLLGILTAFRLIRRSTSEIFYIFYTIICTFPFCNIFTYLVSSSQMWVSWSMVQLFRFNIFKKNCIIILYFVKVQQIQVWGYTSGLLYNFISPRHVLSLYAFFYIFYIILFCLKPLVN